MLVPSGMFPVQHIAGERKSLVEGKGEEKHEELVSIHGTSMNNKMIKIGNQTKIWTQIRTNTPRNKIHS